MAINQKTASNAEAGNIRFNPEDKMANRFLLSVAVAKRARQIKEGARALVASGPEYMNPVVTALEEIKQDKLNVVLVAQREEEEELMEEINQYVDLDVIEKSEEEKPKKEAKTKSKSKSLAA